MRDQLKDLLYTSFLYYKPNTPNQAVPNGPVCGGGDVGVSMDLTDRGVRLWLGKNDFWCYRPAHFGGGMKSAAFLTVTAEDRTDARPLLWQNAAEGKIGARFLQGAARAELEVFAPRGRGAVLLRLRCLSGSFAYEAQADALSADPLCSVRRETRSGMRLIVKSYEGEAMDRPSAVATAFSAVSGKPRGRLAAGEQALFAAFLATDAESTAPAGRALALCRAVDAAAFGRMEAENARWWDAFWGASDVELPDLPDVERTWYLSHYILACCCDPDKYAPGIFGNFLTTDSPNWGGDYHLNYNHEAPFWGLYSSNHTALADAYDRPVLEYVEKARQNAREELGCRGLYSKVGVAPGGYEVSAMFDRDGNPDPQRPYWGQKSNSSYAGINFIMRYYHTLDRDYLEKKAYPYLREVADFWEDYLAFEDGRYVDKNDFIHEEGDYTAHATDRDWDGDGTPPDRNPVVSLALIRVTFRAVLDMSRTLGVDADRREKWAHILAHLSPYPTQMREGRTVFRYTEVGRDWCDDNSLGIQAAFPAGDIGLDSDPALLRIARDTHAIMGRWEDYNAFPTFYTAAARLGCDPEEILRNMRVQIGQHGYANGFIYYGGGGIECCSAVPSAVNDMLVQNYAGRLRLFPVWNRARDAAFRDLRVWGALLVSARLKNGRISGVRIVSERGGTVRLVPPWEGETRVVCGSAPVEIRRDDAGDLIFDTLPGGVYELAEPDGRP